MITTEDIKKLAKLSRMEVSDEEIESLKSQADSILGYVGKIQGISAEADIGLPSLRNVFREDAATHAANEYTEAILSEAPSREGGYIKVKKILS
jgi:aspartyl-tRNA(Asn)/glutamyl-tRNA(Gln) amidotransferase subunit C